MWNNEVVRLGDSGRGEVDQWVGGGWVSGRSAGLVGGWRGWGERGALELTSEHLPWFGDLPKTTGRFTKTAGRVSKPACF